MAHFRYFADVRGETFELTAIRHNGGSAMKASNFSGRAPNGELIPATRVIEMKSNPSKHVCDARCMNATGRVMKCECSCGGKNHGKGTFVAEAACWTTTSSTFGPVGGRGSGVHGRQGHGCCVPCKKFNDKKEPLT